MAIFLELNSRVVTGIYFQYNNEPTNPAVKDWNVTEMRVRLFEPGRAEVLTTDRPDKEAYG